MNPERSKGKMRKKTGTHMTVDNPWTNRGTTSKSRGTTSKSRGTTSKSRGQGGGQNPPKFTTTPKKKLSKRIHICWCLFLVASWNDLECVFSNSELPKFRTYWSQVPFDMSQCISQHTKPTLICMQHLGVLEPCYIRDLRFWYVLMASII